MHWFDENHRGTRKKRSTAESTRLAEWTRKSIGIGERDCSPTLVSGLWAKLRCFVSSFGVKSVPLSFETISGNETLPLVTPEGVILWQRHRCFTAKMIQSLKPTT